MKPNSWDHTFRHSVPQLGIICNLFKQNIVCIYKLFHGSEAAMFERNRSALTGLQFQLKILVPELLLKENCQCG
jgi:hypothetical protein